LGRHQRRLGQGQRPLRIRRHARTRSHLHQWPPSPQRKRRSHHLQWD